MAEMNNLELRKAIRLRRDTRDRLLRIQALLNDNARLAKVIVQQSIERENEGIELLAKKLPPWIAKS